MQQGFWQKKQKFWKIFKKLTFFFIGSQICRMIFTKTNPKINVNPVNLNNKAFFAIMRLLFFLILSRYWMFHLEKSHCGLKRSKLIPSPSFCFKRNVKKIFFGYVLWARLSKKLNRTIFCFPSIWGTFTEF